jgi:predicted Zn finger-like uncharacterized protein
MIITCPSCSARYQYAEARFQGADSKRFQCPKCGTVFQVLNPGLAPTPPPMPAQPIPAVPVAPPPTPVPTPVPMPTPPPPPAATLQKERSAMLTAAGLGEGSLPAGIRYSLAFLSGPQASTVRQLAKPATIIGREEGDVIINDPETSRKHARIDIHSDGTAWITDLGSTNGTSLAGRIIDGPTQLLDRQEFSCGKSTFMLLIRTLDPPSVD